MKNFSNEFAEFLHANLNQKAESQPHKNYRPGITNTQFLEETNTSLLDEITRAKFLYVKNLALINPERFDVPTELHPIEAALMFLSFKDYDNACNILGIDLRYEIVGCESYNSAGARLTTLVLKTFNAKSSDQYDFTDGIHIFKDYKVEPLAYEELIYLYIKMEQLYASEDDKSLTDSHLRAFIGRALFEKNDLNDALRTSFLMRKTELSNDTRELEKIIESVVELSDSLFLAPINFKSDICIQIGRSLMNTYDYGAALEFLNGYPLYDEKINCLIGLKRPSDAASEIQKYINIIGSPSTRGEQITLSNLYIKLGHLYQDTRYFDMAASVFLSAKPHQIKGLWFFNKKRYVEAVDAFERALEITPQNEELRYSHGCALIELDRVAEALRIFKLLKSENPRSENISKNLSYCYYKIDDIENTLNTLRAVALQDHSAMKQFLYISIKNKHLDNIKWALQRMNYDIIVEDAVHYLSQNARIEFSELRAILEENPSFDKSQISKIFDFSK